jgi:hypothetical protein
MKGLLWVPHVDSAELLIYKQVDACIPKDPGN